ncbi:DUF6087 family protein [Streptomyces formicae]|uniref:DUF6087 family protein n=1 Tax=Streptomyces formicae TaxID=1616117 RepID=UPI0030D86639
MITRTARSEGPRRARSRPSGSFRGRGVLTDGTRRTGRSTVTRGSADCAPCQSFPATGPKGSHLNPDAPRAIERWNGHAWEPYAFAANLGEARRTLYPEANSAPTPTPGPVRQPLAPGAGRHRKP